jgi:hypothetical protein
MTNATIDAVLAMARHQAGAFSRIQALSAGCTLATLRAQVDARRWQRAYPGVLVSFTGPLPDETRLWAALLWAGDGAALSGQTALAQYGFVTASDDSRVHVSVDHARRVVAPPGIVLTRRRRLDEFVHPVRSPRTLRVDDAALHVASEALQLTQGFAVLADVCQQGLTTPHRLRAALVDLPKLTSRKALWSVLDDIASGTHSFLEMSYQRDVEHAHRLPVPHRQCAGLSLGGRVWRDAEYDEFGVILELDGRLGHNAFEDRARDRRRDAIAAATGKLTLRSGYPEVVDRACETAALVACVLRNRGWSRWPIHCGDRCRLSEVMEQLESDAARTTKSQISVR